MKPKFVIVTGTALMACSLIAVLLLAMNGCSTTPTRPPTAFEKKFFDVQTNYVPVVIPVTNFVPVTVLQTNTVTVTNIQGVVAFQTNVVPVTVQEPQVSMVQTQAIGGYVLKPGAGAKTVETVGGAAAGLFGYGGIVTTLLAGIFGIWAQRRSSANYDTSAQLAQNVETIREFIKQLPNGATYDATLTQFIQQHQTQAGVIQQVLGLLQNEVSNNDAKAAALQISQTIAALQASNPANNPATPTPAKA